ncbi:MAG TPA: hypothetical protein VFZ97_10605 [Acidimicrobiales bacterium]
MADATDELWTRSLVTVYDGKIEDFTDFIGDLLSTIREKDSDTLNYSVFLDRARSEAIILEHYSDSTGWEIHTGNLSGLLPRFPELCKFAAIEVYGNPTPQARHALDAAFEGVGVSATYYPTLAAL